MMKLIKTFDKSLALSLKEKGFDFRIENINRQEVYVFLYTNKLQQTISKNFDKNSFFTDSTLRF